MFARCPACQTVFRVRPEQLRAHHGEVRCGRCYAPFNALDHLFETAPPAGAAAPTPPTRAPVSPAHPAPPGTQPIAQPAALQLEPEKEPPAAPEHVPVGDGSDGFFLLEERDEPAAMQDELPLDDYTAPDVLPHHDYGGRLDFEIPDSLVARRTPGGGRAPLRREPTVGADAFPEFLDLSDLSPAPARDAAPSAPAAPSTYDPWTTDGRREPALSPAPFAPPDEASTAAGATDAETAAASGRSEPAPPSSPQPSAADRQDEEDRPADTVLPGAPLAEPETPESELARLDATYGAPAAPRRRALLGVGVGILLGALVAQSAYLFRDDITRRWPLLRPAFLSACERLRCTIPLPRIAAAISIEASDLQSEPGRPGRLQLNATIRNRAAHPQAYPHLELTLTDAQDRPVVRRVLAPEEWVPPPALEQGGLERGFDAGRDVVLRLPFDAPGLNASGYRLYVFYP